MRRRDRLFVSHDDGWRTCSASWCLFWRTAVGTVFALFVIVGEQWQLRRCSLPSSLTALLAFLSLKLLDACLGSGKLLGQCATQLLDGTAHHLTNLIVRGVGAV